MFFSVIIPVRRLSYYLIFENLPALAKQISKNFEVIVLPNQHEQYDLTLLKTYKWLKIIPTGTVTRPAEKRDLGVKEAKGDVIAFIDDDAHPRSDWLKHAEKVFKKTGSEAVCGPGILPPHADRWEKIFDQVIKTFAGSGTFSYRFTPGKERHVDDYPSMNFFIRKNIFEKLGGFNSDFWPGEDSKLCEDLIYKEKGKILYHPDVIVYHHRRKDLGGYLKQHANYGFHRGAFFAHGDKNSRRVSYLIPTMFVGYVLVSPLLMIVWFLFKPITNLLFILYIPAFLYLFGLLYVFFLALLDTVSLRIAVVAPVVLFSTHVVYGISFVKGFFKGLKNKKNIYT